jgi:hypothetical protein
VTAIAGWGAFVRAVVPLVFPGIVAVVVFNLFLDRFITGFTMGAVKG